MADLDTNETDEVTIADFLGINKLSVSAAGAAKVDGSASTQPTTAVDVTGTGSITGSGQTVVANCVGASSISWQLSGIFTASYTFEASCDGTTWVVNGYQGQTNGIGMVQIPCGGYKQMRLRCTAYTSGTLSVIWYTGLGVNLVMPVQVSGTTLVVSATALPLPTGAATAANQATEISSLASIDAALPVTLGQTTMANSLAVVIASDQSAVPVTAVALTNGTQKTQIVDGSGNVITSTAETSKQSLDVTVVAPAASYYSLPVNIRQTAATAANATVFAMRNAAASTKTVYIEDIELLMAFDVGTPLTRSLQRYDLVRFSAATPTAGTALTVVMMDSAAAATQVTDARFVDTGLTTTSVSFGTAFATISCPATDATTSHFHRSGIALKLAAGEGFCIRLTVAAVVGQSLSGCITWSER